MNGATPTYYFCINNRGNVLEAIAIPDIENSPGPENYRQINELLKNKNKTVASTKTLTTFQIINQN